MKKVYIDTNALVALNDGSDGLHKRAVKVLKQLSEEEYQAYLGTNILLETITIVSQRINKNQALLLLDELRSGKYRVIHPGEGEVAVAEEIFRSIKSKNVSYSDCVSMAIMRRQGIELVFSFDVDFRKQGLKRVGVDVEA